MRSSPRFSLETAGLVLLAACVLAGIAYSLTLPAHARFPDEEEYLNLSGHLLHNGIYSWDGVRPTAGRPPGYPFFLAGIASVGGGMAAMRIAQYLIFGATILLVTKLVPPPYRHAGVLTATVVTMIYPALFYTSGTLYPQTLGAFFFVVALLLLLYPGNAAARLASGLAFGALMLIIPPFALTLVVVLAAAWILRMINWRQGLLVVAGAAVMLTPWIIRNEVVFHRLIPFASNSGENLLIGNCENTTPYGGSGNVDRTSYQDEVLRRGLNEFEADAYYKQAALDWIKRNPGSALVLYLEKTANYFNVYNEYAAGTKAEVSRWKQVVLGASYVLLLALVAWRLSEAGRYPLLAREKLFLAVYVLTAFTMAIFVTRIRYRLPYDYLLVAIVAMHASRRLEGWLGPARITKST